MSTNSTGSFLIPFDNATGSAYKVFASQPGFFGVVNATAPEDNATLDIKAANGTDLGGIFEIKDDQNGTVGQVDIPPAAANGTTIKIQSKASSHNSTTYKASGDLLYVVNATDNTGKSISKFADYIQITIPFDLDVVEPGGFENGTYQVYYADNQQDLLAGNGTALNATDIVPVDYIGDGTNGQVTFQVDHLTVFGIAASSQASPSSGTTPSTSGGSTPSTGGGTSPVSSSKTADTDDDDVCFIATAAFGSLFEPQVQILRDFRDRYLMTSTVGRAFVDAYYTYSPPLADFIAEHELLRVLVRWSLLPLIGLSWIALQAGPLLAILALFGSLALLTLTPVLFFRSRREARG